jgi:pilus assembly protein CpaB
MRKRMIAVVAAAVLAAAGVLALVMWAQDADERAYAGAQRKTVVQVTEAVPAGKKVADLGSSFEETKLPVDAIPDGAVTDLTDVAGLSTLTGLQPGEVLLKSRLGTPGDRSGSSTTVPEGLQEISVTVDAQHAVGGAIKAGDKVGVIVSFEPKDSKAPQFTDFALQDVLVTRVKGGVDAENATKSLVTLAVRTLDAEKVAHSVEWGRVWLTLQNADTDRSGAKIITAKEVVE